MDSSLYNKELKCPVCNANFEVTKVKAKVSKVASRDADFCVHYEGINPLLYDVWVCENCGYAAQTDKFEEISDDEAYILQKTIAPKWTKRSFAGERNIENAIDAFKLALLNLQVRKAKSVELAKVCLRIAWLFRFKNDDKEKEFLNFALNNYIKIYDVEKFPVDKLDEYTCMYMIAELSRRVGQIDESLMWFNKLINSQGARENPKLIETAREQFLLAKEAKV